MFRYSYTIVRLEVDSLTVVLDRLIKLPLILVYKSPVDIKPWCTQGLSNGDPTPPALFQKFIWIRSVFGRPITETPRKIEVSEEAIFCQTLMRSIHSTELSTSNHARGSGTRHGSANGVLYLRAGQIRSNRWNLHAHNPYGFSEPRASLR